MKEITASHIKEVNALHAKIVADVKKTLADVLEAGSMLTKIQDALPVGEFRKWIADNADFAETTARRYMRCWQHRAAIHSQRILEVMDAYKLISSPPSADSEIKSANGSKAFVPQKNQHGSPQVESCRTPEQSEPEDIPHGTKPSLSNVPTKPVDETGFPLPPTALKSWTHRELVQSWMTALTRIKSEFIALQDSPLFKRQKQIVVAHLTTTYSAISDCKPYAVCTECSGQPEKQSGKFCTFCGLSGVISKYNYDLQAKSSVKEIREKAGKRCN